MIDPAAPDTAKNICIINTPRAAPEGTNLEKNRGKAVADATVKREIRGKDEVPGSTFLVSIPPNVTRHDDKQSDVPIDDNVMPLPPSDGTSSILSGSITAFSESLFSPF